MIKFYTISFPLFHFHYSFCVRWSLLSHGLQFVRGSGVHVVGHRRHIVQQLPRHRVQPLAVALGQQFPPLGGALLPPRLQHLKVHESASAQVVGGQHGLRVGQSPPHAQHVPDVPPVAHHHRHLATGVRVHAGVQPREHLGVPLAGRLTKVASAPLRMFPSVVLPLAVVHRAPPRFLQVLVLVTDDAVAARAHLCEERQRDHPLGRLRALAPPADRHVAGRANGPGHVGAEDLPVVQVQSRGLLPQQLPHGRGLVATRQREGRIAVVG